MRKEFGHCQGLVRDHDRDRYLAVLFAPEMARPYLFAVYAFNAEISLVGDRARDPLAGEARLQWWREAVSGNAAAGVAANPVASALDETIVKCGLPRAGLARMIEARMFDLFSEPMPTVQALNAYLNDTAVPVFSLAAKIAGAADKEIEAVALDAGIAYGLTQLLRNFPFHASRGKIYLPLDMLNRHGVDAAAILQGMESPGLAAALAELRGIARDKWQAAEKRIAALQRDVRRIFLPLALVPSYLALMDRPDYRPFRTPAEVPQWRRQWTLWRAARRF